MAFMQRVTLISLPKLRPVNLMMAKKHQIGEAASGNAPTVQTCHGASLPVDVSSLQGGINLLRVVTDNGVETGRFVKN